MDDGSLPRRPLAKISLAINYYLSGGTSHTFGYKLTNLAIHLVNTGLVYWFSLLLIRRQAWRLSDAKHIVPEWIAILVAALWALHPLHLTTVLYVVQRMTSLATLFVLAGLIVYIHGRERIHKQRAYGYVLMAVGAIGGSVLGFACKENAVVLLPLMLVIEFIFFGVTPETPADRRKLMLFYGLTVLIPATLLGLWLIIHPHFILDAYLAREFTLIERVLTETRVLWYYVGLLFIPDVRQLSIYHDDIPISTGLFDPWTTPLALLSVISVVIFAVMVRRRYPLFSFAVLWFLVGHSLESSVIGLEIAHEHRNYLPDIGILLAVGYGLSVTVLRFRKSIRSAILLAPLITLGFTTHTLAHTWSSDEAIIETLVRHHPGSARGQYMLAELYAEKKYDLNNALVHYQRAAELAPNETGYLVKSAVTAARIDSGLRHNASNASDRSKYSEIINHGLKEKPLIPTTLHILEQLAGCTDLASELCRLLYPDITDWYLAVAQNPYLGKKDRGNFIIYLFNLGTARPDLSLSLQAARLGKKLEPSNPVYDLMEANVYILRGDLETADGILQSVLKNSADKLTNKLRKDITTLSTQIEARKIKLRSRQNHVSPWN
jgi:tetratricopeptide (TPR) repeat protein